jgi:SAM-dependent methyltransferase
VDFRALEERAWRDASVTELYEALFVRVTAHTIDPLLDRARVGPARRVLDLACGPGRVAGRAAARRASVVGLDFSPAMVERARAAQPGLPFEVGDASQLPFSEASFDAVVCNYGLLHFDRPDLAFAEAARVLHPGGWAAFAVWTEAAVLFQLIPSAIQELGFDPHLPPGPPFFQFGREGGLATALASVGLAPEPPVTLSWTAHLTSQDEFWTMFERGSVRTRASLEGLTPVERREVHSVVDQRLKAYERPEGLTVPVEALIGAAEKR